MNFKTILLGSAAALSIAALAQSNSAIAAHHGWYVGIEGGANWVQKDNFVDVQPGDTNDPTGHLVQTFDTGWAVLGTIGYAFDNNWRLEGEFGYRHNKLDKTKTLASGEPTTTAASHGNLSEFTLMANAIYDIHLTDKLSLSIGAGVGADDARLKIAAREPEITLPVEGEFVDESHWSFAYQAIAGLNYALTDRTQLFVDYRYLDVPNPHFSNAVERASFDDFKKHTVTIGLRYDLTPDEEPMMASPPPPPPPEPVAPHQYIIFFGFNKYNLTPEAMRVLGEAAAAAKQYGSASILVTGHTDTVGSNRYNMRLSIRRANAAKKGLIDQGVSPGSISTSGKGETELLVQTADGVKEPQNRRASVDLN